MQLPIGCNGGDEVEVGRRGSTSDALEYGYCEWLLSRLKVVEGGNAMQ